MNNMYEKKVVHQKGLRDVYQDLSCSSFILLD